MTSRRRFSEPVYQAPSPIVEDAYQGQGGSYILDSRTGVRTPVQRTPEPQEVIPDGTSDSQASDSD